VVTEILSALKPIDVFKKREIPSAIEVPKQDKLKAGDKVRTLIKRKTFDKKGFFI
jgi:hypothetical protein